MTESKIWLKLQSEFIGSHKWEVQRWLASGTAGLRNLENIIENVFFSSVFALISFVCWLQLARHIV